MVFTHVKSALGLFHLQFALSSTIAKDFYVKASPTGKGGSGQGASSSKCRTCPWQAAILIGIFVGRLGMTVIDSKVIAFLQMEDDILDEIWVQTADEKTRAVTRRALKAYIMECSLLAILPRASSNSGLSPAEMLMKPRTI